MEQLIHNFVHLLVGQTHRLEVDLVVEQDLRLANLLVALGQDVVRVVEQTAVQDLYCLALPGVTARLRRSEELRTDTVLGCVQLQVGEELLQHLSCRVPSEIFGRASVDCESNLDDDFLESLEIQSLWIVSNFAHLVVHLPGERLYFFGGDVVFQAVIGEHFEHSGGEDEAVEFAVLIEALQSIIAFLFAAVVGKVDSQRLLVSLQHVLQPLRVSVLFCLLDIEGQVDVLPSGVLFLAVELKQILQLLLRHVLDLETHLHNHLLLVDLLQDLAILLHLRLLVPPRLLHCHLRLVELHVFLYAHVRVVLNTCQAQTHWMGTLHPLRTLQERRVVVSLVLAALRRWRMTFQLRLLQSLIAVGKLQLILTNQLTHIAQ